jgi:hypothetical protein
LVGCGEREAASGAKSCPIFVEKITEIVMK